MIHDVHVPCMCLRVCGICVLLNGFIDHFEFIQTWQISILAVLPCSWLILIHVSIFRHVHRVIGDAYTVLSGCRTVASLVFIYTGRKCNVATAATVQQWHHCLQWATDINRMKLCSTVLAWPQLPLIRRHLLLKQERDIDVGPRLPSYALASCINCIDASFS